MVNKMKRIFLWLITLIFLGSSLAYAEVNYTTSAHGDSSSGVDRKSPFPGYAVGNCAHCHEQHASIGGNEPAPSSGTTPPTASKFCLFADNFDTTATTGPYSQDDNFCFYCHTSGSVGASLQSGGITNNDYSTTFGGASSDKTGILETFNQTSYHNLNKVLNFATGEWSSTFTSNSNPCSGCHNVHIAKRNKENQDDPAFTAISKPSDHNNLWGDDSDSPNERLSNSTGSYYQPPYYSGGTTYEPDDTGNSTLQAGKTPDYISFCQDCHQSEVPSNTTSGNPNTTSGNLTAIDWTTITGESGGDKHGKNIATIDSADPDVYVNLDEPYATAWGSSNGLVLACTDCHEPHGSQNVMLIRRQVNNGAVGSTGDWISSYSTTKWKYLCERCHDCDTDAALEDIHHTNGPYYPYKHSGAPYKQCKDCHGGNGGSKPPIACDNCHFHGGSDTAWVTARGKTPSNRRTF